MASFFSFAAPVDVDVRLENEDARKQVEVKLDKDRRERCPIYFDGENVKGVIQIRVRDGKKIQHEGIKVEFIGSIEMFYDRGNHYEFLSLTQELASPGELRQAATYEFDFKNVEKQFESYNGINVKLRYFVRVLISRRLADVIKEREVWVHSYRMPPEINNAIKMEVGIEDCLHIEFEYNKSKYHLKDVIVGKIYFLLVRIKIKHMELSIIRRETTGAPPNQYNESETITKFEIMDGAPVRGETIPIRLFLGGFELTPTFRDVNKKFSTRYYLNLVLIDEENRRYFKQQEITVFTDSSFKKTYQEVGSDHTTSGDLNAQYMNEARQSGPADPASSTSTSERSQLDPSVADPEQEADLRQQGWTNKPSDTNGTRETAGEDEMRARLSG
ncbi:Vacuolar protein sorting-associated protein 26 [Tilletia horrida]|nr:Vacuolar protein sorting-associated protein 26 [Tilletia horrida]